jgi:membrane associated rhomboid family serine protease
MIRFIGLVLAAALLNVGLYVVLFVAAPLVSGLICGYLILSPRWGAFVGFLGSVAASIPLLFFLESLSSSGADVFSILIAALILSVIGAAGGFIGGVIGMKSRPNLQTRV